ncbi:MAG: acyl-ACP--UDP-N-acetylglucosamine O-acyltransferase [Candidatus Goldbacteria bacterium]|nr:acyl-ACP--UDP-N-acetylglucosamine O-acyltransferase [Candidatus Goldiibacteriota bacterium]HPD18669.1 acyl-ACP--UDP-N-acetylglucosamine O-acyltransferase [Candidatus Goldiibacteriota bacterium]
MIHETALVSKKAKMGKDVRIGPFAIIDDEVEIGDNCEIGPKVHLLNGTKIGNNNYIGEGTLIGNDPQDLKFKGEKTYVHIGDNNVIREYVTIHRSTGEGKATTIGNGNFIMTMAHIAHDCKIGNNVIIVNYAGLSGHIQIDDYAFISGLTAIHQNVHIGSYCMLGGGLRVAMDVVPFMLVADYPAKIIGVNKVGLKRRGFTKEKIELIEKLHRIVFRSRLQLKEALKKIENELPATEEVKYFIDFIKNSKRGILR